MRTQIINTLSWSGIISCILMLILASFGCPTSDESATDLNSFENFSFVQPEGSDQQCDGDCEPRVVDMCTLTRQSDVLAFVEILDVTEHRDECQNRPYRYDYREVSVDVLDVAAGEEDFASADRYRMFLTSGHVEPGKSYLITLTRVEDTWWARGVTEILPGDHSSQILEHEDSGKSGLGHIFDLPRNRTDFIAEAQKTWNDYEQECDEPGGRVQLPRQGFVDYIHGKSCSSPGDSEGSHDGIENNIDGPIPGDDTYDAGE